MLGVSLENGVVLLLLACGWRRGVAAWGTHVNFRRVICARMGCCVKCAHLFDVRVAREWRFADRVLISERGRERLGIRWFLQSQAMLRMKNILKKGELVF